MLQFVILLCSVSYLFASNCKPLEENRPYSLLKRWRPTEHDRSKVALEKDGVIYATCNTDMTCVNYFDHIAQTHIKPHSDGSYLINHTIYNATRKEVGQWVLKYAEGLQNDQSVISICFLKSYVKIHKVQCEKQLTETSLIINCKAVRVFPQARCRFLMIHNETIHIDISDIVYIHEATGDENHFNSFCQLHVPFQSTYTGTYSIDVNMFPNITGDDSDVQYGASTAIHFAKDGSAQLSVQQCEEDIVEESLDKQKVCLVKSQGLPIQDKPYFNVPTASKPAIVEDKANINGRCDIDTYDEEMVVKCSFVHTYPERFRCEIFLKKKEEEYLTIDGSLKTTELGPDTVSRYLSQCTYIVSGSYIEPGLYEATVTASEHDGKMSTGKNISIYFDLDVKDSRNRIEKSEKDEYIELHHIFILAITGMVIIIVLFLLAFKFKIFKRHKTKSVVDHNYEDVDNCYPSNQRNDRETIYINLNKSDDNNNTLLETSQRESNELI